MAHPLAGDPPRPPLKLAAFYHVYADGDWREPVAEYLQTLWDSDFPRCPRIGLVGSRANRRIAQRMIGDCLVVAEADTGFEQVTLHALHQYAQLNDGAILYAHTKAASETTDERYDRTAWRHAMNQRVIAGWQENLTALGTHDAVGCHWLTPGMNAEAIIHTPFFAGNFWMARCDYLRQLPDCPTRDRMDAETWLGQREPRVRDLLPGWISNEQWA